MPSTSDTAVQRPPRADVVPGYQLGQLVGKGGMGEVYQAVQLSLGRTVAVKLLNAELAKDAQFVARFEKEGAALAALRHPSIVSIVDRGSADGTYFLVMEFVDGESLRERMRSPDFDATQALRVLVQICRAVDYAHGRGVIHRDLKPENILFDEQAGDLAKVTDFGLAGFDDGGSGGRNLTQTNMSMGTLSYMAPEQRIDAKTAGPRADLYALGVMLYELLVGEVPMGTFDPPSLRRPALDPRLDAIVDRCLKPSPDDRYPTVAALLAELEPMVQFTQPPAASKETRLQKALRRAREVSRTVSIWGAGVLVALAAAIVVAAFLRARVERQRTSPGVALMTDFGARFPLSTRGRLDAQARTLTLGEGPDTIGLMSAGRQATLHDGDILFEPEDAPTGRAVIDAQVEGDGLVLRTEVDTEALPPSALEPLWALFRGPRPPMLSAVMLVGEHGRYVALVISGEGREPQLEWSLGPQRRGQMTAPLPTAATKLPVELRIDPATGELFATLGAGRDARLFADGLALGPRWREEFGDNPRVAVGCLEGACVFRGLTVAGLTLGSALVPPPTPAPDVPVPAPASPPAASTRAPVRPQVVAVKPVETKPAPVVAKPVPVVSKPAEVKPAVKPVPVPAKPAPVVAPVKKPEPPKVPPKRK